MANKILESMWKIMKENKFQLINEINNDLICDICNKLMVKVCNALCSCKYCSDCIENYLDGEDKCCPGQEAYCKMKMINFERDVVVNFPTNIKISKIVVKCPNKHCEIQNELGLIENHVRTCDKNPISCPYFEMGCKNNEIINDEMKDHLCTEIYCHTKLLLDSLSNLGSDMESMKKNIVELKAENIYLKEELNKIKIESKNNQMKNEEFEKRIKNNLSEIEELNVEMVAIKNENRSLVNKLEIIEKSRMQNEKVIEKIQQKSEQQTQQIEEVKEKCEQTEIKEIEMRRIIDEIFDKNADLMTKSNIDYDEKINNYDEKIKNYDEKIINYDEKIINYDEKINNYDEKIINYDEKINEGIEEMRRKSEQQTRQIDEMKEKCEQTENKEIEMRRIIDEIFDKNADLMTKSNKYDEKINTLQLKLIEIERITEIMNFGEFEWKIENFSEQNRETDIYSESFYSHKNGYKMCLRIWIRKDEVVCVIRLHLMKGEYDNDLLWPFKHGITIDIINQMNGTVDRSKTRKYDDPKCQEWDKPKNERNVGILFHEVNKPIQLTQNNQMLIKCKIKIGQ